MAASTLGLISNFFVTGIQSDFNFEEPNPLEDFNSLLTIIKSNKFYYLFSLNYKRDFQK